MFNSTIGLNSARMSGSDWWKKESHSDSIEHRKFHTGNQWFSILTDHQNHLTCLKSQRYQEITQTDWVKISSSTWICISFNSSKMTQMHVQLWGPIHLVFDYLIFPPMHFPLLLPPVIFTQVIKHCLYTNQKYCDTNII